MRLLVLPLLIQLVYQAVLRVHIAPSARAPGSSPTDCANKATVAVSAGADVATVGARVFRRKAIGDRRVDNDTHVLCRKKWISTLLC